MISIELADQLKSLGLKWHPKPFDRFAIPDRDLDDRIFVISELQSGIERIQGHPMVTFHGTAEWAVDYLISSEAIWLPDSDQLQAALFNHLTDLLSHKTRDPHGKPNRDGDISITLQSTPQGHRCEFRWAGAILSFKGSSACDAYAHALIYLLKNHPLRR